MSRYLAIVLLATVMFFGQVGCKACCRSEVSLGFHLPPVA